VPKEELETANQIKRAAILKKGPTHDEI